MALTPLLWLLCFQGDSAAHLERGTLSLRLPCPFMQEQVLLENLKSGLTTTFEYRVTVQQGGKARMTGAILEVRYELWDEVFLLRRLKLDGTGDELQFKDIAALTAWFHQVQIFQLSDPITANDLLVEVQLRIIPFSEKEQAETLKWVNQGVGAPGTRNNVSQPGNRVFTMIMGNSIRRETLLEYQWRLLSGASL
ncbi:MAG: hypothetical protein KDC71_20595 [Acidobacteria bacterium]|nr:hypothetical protein [Acidobacteriota bacterium]